MPIIQCPALLKRFTHQEVLIISGGNLYDTLSNLTTLYPSLKPYLLDLNGKICSFISIYINGQDIRTLDYKHIPLTEKDVITIVPAIAGG